MGSLLHDETMKLTVAETDKLHHGEYLLSIETVSAA